MMRFGWYFNKHTRLYEFWWQGNDPMITLTQEVFSLMPEWFQREVNNGMAAKGHIAEISELPRQRITNAR